jgi:hypothetical protein
VRCPRCGNENSEDNRFCGMCGAKLAPAPAVAVTSPVAVAASRPHAPALRTSAPVSPVTPVAAQLQIAPPARPAAPLQDSPGISGPSFLGLNDPPPRMREGFSADRHSGSNNLDYLLEDEEEHKSGAGKFILILLMVALAGGLGYLRFKNQGIPWLHLGSNKPAATQSPDATDTTSSPPASSASTPLNSGPAQPSTQTAPAVADSSSGTSGAAAPGAGSPADGNRSATADAGSSSTNPASAKADSAKGDADSANGASNPPTGSSPATEAADKKVSSDEETEAPDSAPAPRATPKKAAAESAPKPAKPPAGVAAGSAADPVSEAQKYIYGRGVGQDCDRGMRLLKPAAAQANPKAMIEMGALYSAGLCAPHDLPTAYRWFAMALRKEPDNRPVQADLQKLWGEMTQPERQLAIRLSQ